MQLRGVGLTVFISLCGPAFAQAQAIVTETEVQAALLALPPDLRPGAAVFSFASDGSRIQHRDGENGFACQTDDPARAELSVLCYHETLLPFESRRRELAHQEDGLPFNELLDRLENEVRRGILSFPNVASRFYLSAPADCFDLQTGYLCADATRFFELVTPWQTGASMGLPEDQGSGLPWVMHSGTMMAHVMVEMPPVP